MFGDVDELAGGLGPHLPAAVGQLDVEDLLAPDSSSVTHAKSFVSPCNEMLVVLGHRLSHLLCRLVGAHGTATCL